MKKEFIDKSLNQLVKTRVKDNKISLENLAKILQSNHYREILKRGFALIKNEKGDLISSIQEVKLKKEIQIEMSDGEAFILFNEIVNRS